MKNCLIKVGLICLLCLSGCQAQPKQTAIMPTSPQCYKIDTYDYSLPVAANEKVDASYYDDALFVGDSRMGSLALYGSYDNQEVYYIEALFLNKVDITQLEDGQTIMDKIKATEKNNLYLMFGLNEIGWENYQLFVDQYDAFIKSIKEIKPNINIYVFLLYTPTHTLTIDEVAIKPAVDNNNTLLKKMCYDNQVYCLDMDPYFSLNGGSIDDSFAKDGIHLNAPGVKLFEEFIEYHVVKEEDHVKEVCN
ncbi:MAG: GDSL-type esterase/lipase family protein [Erysipelotrichaceae bacterium]|nr:GDSL-type esterase/lipase family protein [Erysipelotrichaceae bacterium]MDY5251369.1 GDSL-type esterase/lipase family protein [Erysipelotrichaceae bacterium]